MFIFNRGEEAHPAMMPPNQILQDITEDPLAEEKGAEEAKIQGMKFSFSVSNIV